jgi:hypothetical protein
MLPTVSKGKEKATHNANAKYLFSHASCHSVSNNKQISISITHNLYFVIIQTATCFGFLVSHKAVQQYQHMWLLVLQKNISCVLWIYLVVYDMLTTWQKI